MNTISGMNIHSFITESHAWLYELNMNDLICSAKYSSYSLVPFPNRP